MQFETKHANEQTDKNKDEKLFLIGSTGSYWIIWIQPLLLPCFNSSFTAWYALGLLVARLCVIFLKLYFLVWQGVLIQLFILLIHQIDVNHENRKAQNSLFSPSRFGKMKTEHACTIMSPFP